MYESVVEWVIIGLLLINVIVLNNWHRIMHIKVQKLADAINLIVVMQMIDKQVSKSSDKLDVENSIQIHRWDMGEDEGNKKIK